MARVAAFLVDTVGVTVAVSVARLTLVDVGAGAARSLVARPARALETAFRVSAVSLHVAVVLVRFALVHV